MNRRKTTRGAAKGAKVMINLARSPVESHLHRNQHRLAVVSNYSINSDSSQKRKAQNRAAQRAFRERKEKHLKDLETKVEDLEKASESANHENGLLRAQVERLQVELKEYRKRLSWISSNGFNKPPQSASFGLQARNMNGSNNNDFQFEFPKFGDLP